MISRPETVKLYQQQLGLMVDTERLPRCVAKASPLTFESIAATFTKHALAWETLFSPLS